MKLQDDCENDIEEVVASATQLGYENNPEIGLSPLLPYS